MVCDRCGSRMVSKSATGLPSLVCTDCGFPADARAYQAAARRSWRAALALAGFAALSGLVLVGAVMLDLNRGSDPAQPAAMERAE